MLYNLFCDKSWVEPITYETEVPLQSGNTVHLQHDENDGTTYMVTDIEHTGLRHDGRIDYYKGSGVLIANLIKLSDAELDKGTWNRSSAT